MCNYVIALLFCVISVINTANVRPRAMKAAAQEYIRRLYGNNTGPRRLFPLLTKISSFGAYDLAAEFNFF